MSQTTYKTSDGLKTPNMEFSLPPVNEDRAAEFERAEAARQVDRRYRSWRHTLPAEHQQSQFGTYQPATANMAAICQHLAEIAKTGDVSSVVLIGPVGVGKDHLAVSLTRWLVRGHEKTARYMNGQDWFGMVRDGYGAGTPEREMLAIDEDVLVMSDPQPPLGALSQNQANLLYRLFSRRQCKINITTLNSQARPEEAQKAIEAKMGAATLDRIVNQGLVVFCDGPSRRKARRVIKP